MTNDRLDRFTKLLKEIFELDKSDLDFGIYRVMNLRKTKIEEFLTDRLPKMVRDTLEPFAQGSKEEIQAQMAAIEANAAQFGMEAASLPENNPMGQKYRALQKQLAEGADLAALETDVYSALYSFFNRYYEDGDFISKRRYKEGVYAIPYEGEEVNLNLIVDTKHFPNTFKYALMESFPNLSEQTNGLMVQGDNIQALTLLDTTYRGRVKCIHIDPPYNTDTSGFLYKNNYRHSSWMSMMDDRINAAIPFLSHEASFICHIDENEYENLWYLFQNKNLRQPT